MKYDLIIKNGTVFDGTDAPPVSADIAVKDGNICSIGKLFAADAQKVFDAKGKIVCPGFIDAHAHSETSIFRHPDGEHKLAQGITLELTGQCGGSAFPSTRPNGKTSFPDLVSYREYALAQGFSVNQGSLVGHGNLRRCALGDGDIALDEEAADKMSRGLSLALSQGALGMSSGLEYAPGMYSDTAEMIPLARLVAERGGVYATHMRSEGNALVEAVDETLEVTRQSGVKTVISHIKACGRPNHGQVARLLDKMDLAVSEGFSVFGDCYPYTAGCTGLSIVLPQWTKAGGHSELMRLLSDSAGREEIRRWFSLGLDVWENRTILTGWENLYIASVKNAANAGIEGKSLAELALIRGKDTADAFLDLLLSENGDVDGILFSACEQDISRALAHPRVMICSDSVDVSGKPHPRLYGSHARYLAKYADLSTDLSTADAIYKMTGLPAEVYNLERVGTIRQGNRADITVFDAASIRDTATFAQPLSLAEGVDAVFVGGVPAYMEGGALHSRSGAFILPSQNGKKE